MLALTQVLLWSLGFQQNHCALVQVIQWLKSVKQEYQGEYNLDDVVATARAVTRQNVFGNKILIRVESPFLIDIILEVGTVLTKYFSHITEVDNLERYLILVVVLAEYMLSYALALLRNALPSRHLAGAHEYVVGLDVTVDVPKLMQLLNILYELHSHSDDLFLQERVCSTLADNGKQTGAQLFHYEKILVFLQVQHHGSVSINLPMVDNVREYTWE